MVLNFFKWFPKDSLPHSPETSVPLLFLHGMGGTGLIWRPITAQLEDYFFCIAPDQRGHGLSRPIPSSEEGRFHALDYAKDVNSLLEQEGIKRVYLIGHSMGVRTALALAYLFPQKIAGIIAVDIGITTHWGGGIGLPLADFIEKLPETFSNRATMRAYLMENCPDPAIAQYLSAVSQRTSENPEIWKFPFDHQALVKTIHEANEAPLDEWLKEILRHQIPCTFLRGMNSKVWSKQDFEDQKLKYQHPLLEFQEWENCGHGLPFEQRQRFVELIKAKVNSAH